MKMVAAGESEMIAEIVGRLIPRTSTAVVLFHHAVAERLGLGPTDHKCLDLLRQRGPMTGSELAAITGLTSGAISGVVGRLEQAGFVRREAHAQDGRKQVLHPAPERGREIQAVFEPVREQAMEMLERFDTHQLAGIAEFLARLRELVELNAALLRAQALCAMSGADEIGQPTSGSGEGHG